MEINNTILIVFAVLIGLLSYIAVHYRQLWLKSDLKIIQFNERNNSLLVDKQRLEKGNKALVEEIKTKATFIEKQKERERKKDLLFRDIVELLQEPLAAYAKEHSFQTFRHTKDKGITVETRSKNQRISMPGVFGFISNSRGFVSLENIVDSINDELTK